MNDVAPRPTTSGPAFRVTFTGAESHEAYEDVYAHLDAEHGVVHVFAADRQTHFLTIPLASALIEWQDPSVLNPAPRFPAFGDASSSAMGDQMQQMIEQMGRAFGRG
jgi:hypothetical protein